MDKEFLKILFLLYPEFVKVYGPYTDRNNDNRQIILLYGANGIRRTLSWPRAMMEVKLGRLLNKEELVDHVDENPTNNTYDNFQILTFEENTNKSILINGRQQKYFKGVCSICGNIFEKPLNIVKHNLKQNKSGPYCSKSCAGKVGLKIGGRKKKNAGMGKR